ncbi:MAG: outer membrane protein assembly factor BamA [Puniceicoccales bacterium]|jgi:outer membrane protein insertion porin family|nr:outer membrane protein assembly factor BamA [Puniceicoccales bacterium]
MRFHRRISIFLCASLLCGQALRGEPEGRPVQEIEFSFRGQAPRAHRDFLLAHVALKKTEPFRAHLADQSLRSLYATQLFSDIRVDAEETEEGVLVRFQLEALPRIQALHFEGNRKISTATLLKKIQTKVGQSLQESRLHEDAWQIQKFYREKGFPFIQAQYRIDLPPQAPEADPASSEQEREVCFLIDEGLKYRIQRIDFSGQEPLRPSQLRQVMLTRTWNILSWLNRRGIFIDEIFQQDLQTLRELFWDGGYLDVRIDPEEVKFHYSPRGSLRITIPIQRGERYTIGSIALPTVELFSAEELQAVLGLVSGQAYAPSAVDAAQERIQDLYGSKGYLQTEVSLSSALSDEESRRMDLKLEIEEGSPTSLRDIQVKGNTRTKNKVILRELSLAPGDPLDTVKMRISQQRLRNTHFFEEVQIHPQDCHSLSQKDLSIQVKEKTTGKASVGGAISAANNIIVFLDISQSNFDLFSPRTRFQGAGQKFNARLQLGTRNTSVTVLFEEPWLFDRELTFGCELFATRDQFKSSDFNYDGPSYRERHLGGEIYFRKALWEYWTGKLSYRLERQRIGDVGKQAPFELKQDAGRRSISRVGFLLERDTRDDLTLPTQGSSIDITNEISGGIFGGSTHFHRLEATAVRHFLLQTKHTQVLSLSGHFGSLSAFRHRRIPYTERFFLGGGEEMRGFGSRDIGPQDAEGYVIGGNSLVYTCAEYALDLFDPMRLAVFGECGYINARKFDLRPKNIHVDYGFGLRILVMGAPLRLDFGFPARRARGTKRHTMQFNFSFSTGF